MRDKHPLAGQTLTVQCVSCCDSKVFVIDDWFENAMSTSWKNCPGNPACINYAMRAAHHGLPLDEDVIYGKVGDTVHLIHNLELLRALYPQEALMQNTPQIPGPRGSQGPKPTTGTPFENLVVEAARHPNGQLGVGLVAEEVDGTKSRILALSVPCAKAMAYAVLQTCYNLENHKERPF